MAAGGRAKRTELPDVEIPQMVNGAAKMGPITGKDDARVTPFGRILRKTKLDG